MDKVDLHIHSIYSDGTFTPEEVVVLAKKIGLKGIAVTDHDTVEGIAAALEAGRRHDLIVLPGIEISAVHEQTPMHILGYGIDHTDETLIRQLKDLQTIRHTRNLGILDKLNGLGVSCDLHDLESLAEGQIGRPHIAKLLVTKGIVPTTERAFHIYLRKNGMAYVPKKKFTAQKAIKMIREAGGLAFLAHPGCMDPKLKSIPALLRQLKKIGLNGVETLYPSHSKSDSKKLTVFCRDLDLLASGGSDFHGKTKPNVMAGTRGGGIDVPYTMLEKIQKYIISLEDENGDHINC